MKAESWFWLSFADDGGFRGAAQVQANSFLAAVLEANRLGINPGGECCGLEITAEMVEASGMPVNKLLSEAEIAEPVNSSGECL
jgi:hypothetical protein